jgi:hypothetical protein
MIDRAYCKNCGKEVDIYESLEDTINCIECFKVIEELKPTPLGVCVSDGVRVNGR